jgi:hypothetical protein
MKRVHVELPGVPEGLTVYVTAYLPQADKGSERGELKLAVEAFGGVAVGNPRYNWKHKAIFNLPDASAAIKELVTAYPRLKLSKTIARIGAAPAAKSTPLPKRKLTEAQFFSPEHKMQWHTKRAQRERAWAEAQQTVSSLITKVVQKTVPKLEGLNKRLCARMEKLRAELKRCGAEVPAPAQQDRQVHKTHAGQAVHAMALAAHAGGQRTATAADGAHRAAPPRGRNGPAAGLRAAGRRCGGHQRHDCQGRRILQRHNARAYLGIKQVILHTLEDDLP